MESSTEYFHESSINTSNKLISKKIIQNNSKNTLWENLFIFDLIIFSLIPVLAQLPNLVTIGAIEKLILLPFYAILFKNLLLIPSLSFKSSTIINKEFSISVSRNSGWTLVAFGLLLTTIAQTRALFTGYNTFSGLMTWIFFGGAASFAIFSSLLLNNSDIRRKQLIGSLSISSCVFVSINLYMFLAGIKNPLEQYVGTANEINTTLAMFGISLKRTSFPLANGVNTFGVIAGAGAISAFGLLQTARTKVGKFIALFSITSCIVAIAMASSRGALMFSILSIVYFYMFPKHAKLNSKLLYIGSLFIPFIIIGIAYAIPEDLVFTLFSRRTTGSVADAISTGRALIWSSVLSELTDPKVEHFIGFGLYGQSVSGVSFAYAHYFPSGLGPSLHTVHNWALQQILDVGYIGLITYVSIGYTAIKRITSNINTKKWDVATTTSAILLYFALSGATEAAPSIYYTESYLMFLMISSFAIIGFRNKPENQPI